MSGKEKNTALFERAGYIRVTRVKEFLDESHEIYISIDEISYVCANRHTNRVKLVMKSKFGIEIEETVLEVATAMSRGTN